MRWYESLRRTADFTRTQRRGRRVGLRTLHAYGLERPSGPVRVGVSVPASVGGAVWRNLIRRRIKGALEALPLEVRPTVRPVDLVFVAHPEAAAAGYPALARDVASALTRLRAGAQVPPDSQPRAERPQRPKAERAPRPR